MAIAAGADWLQTADQAVYDRLDAGRHHDDRLPGWLGELFDPELIIPLALLISLAMYRCRPLAIAFPLAIVLSGLLHVGLAHLVPRERPELGERAGQFDSFPGGHVNELVLLLGLLPLALAVLTKSPRAGAIARVVATALLVVLLANALLVGDHWPSDNLAGICIAGALVIAVHGIAAARPLHTRCRDCLSQRTTGEP
jgi:membrane-associated phospholipid phosphatase